MPPFLQLIVLLNLLNQLTGFVSGGAISGAPING